MIIIDGHLDIAWNAIQWDRDLEKTVAEIRKAEAGWKEKGRAMGTVALPELRRGNVALSFVTTLGRFTGRPIPGADYRSHAAAYAAAKGQLAYYRLLEAKGVARIVTDRTTLDRHMDEWQSKNGSNVPLGFLFTMESADPVQSPDQLSEWWDAGVRAIGPAHYGPGVYAHGTGSKGGLTPVGRELVRRMKQIGFVLDVTHLDDPAFWEALEIFHGPIWASHNNCRALVPAQRQFSDDQLREIIRRDGVIGAVFDNWMLFPNYKMGETPNTCASIADVMNHIDHVCQLAGNANHAAIGSDLDGGYGREQSPHDLDTIANLQQVPVILRQRGYNEADIEKIAHGNWLRVLRRAL